MEGLLVGAGWELYDLDSISLKELNSSLVDGFRYYDFMR